MTLQTLLADVAHRPWPLPQVQWRYYQEWNRLLFMHWKVDTAVLEPLIPAGTTLDTFEGKAWLSIVPFSMQKIRLKHLPAFKPVSDFHEINVRTYVTKDGKPGVFFLNIEAEKKLSAWLSRRLSGLPYEKASISRKQENGLQLFASSNKSKQYHLDIGYEIGDIRKNKTPLDIFLTERYCVYAPLKGELYRYNVHHVAWPLHEVKIQSLDLRYLAGNLMLTAGTPPTLAHYSEGVQVVAWDKEKI